MEKRSKKKTILISFLVTILGVMGGIAAYTAHVKTNNAEWDAKIYPGVKVGTVDISGKTKEQALSILKSKYANEVVKKKINVKAGDDTYTLDYTKLNTHYNIEEVVNEAFKYGKNLEMFAKNSIITKAPEKQFKLTFTSDNTYVDNFISDMAKKANKDPVDAKIQSVSNGKVSITPDQKGAKLKTDELKKQIIASINGEISASSTTIDAPIEASTAKVTQEKLETIDTKISTETTDYSSSPTERKTNVNLATHAINGKVIMPGESFSFNGTVGQRTAAKGYQTAHVIVNGQVDEGLGGGICQVSGTLYNAMLRTGNSVKVTERAHHTFPSTYLPKGTDATVDWGNLDFKFTNKSSYPIYIEGVANNSKLTFNIYSNSSLNAKTYDIVSELVSTNPATSKTINDPTLPKGQTVKDSDAHDGIKVNVYRITKQNGAQVSKDLLYTDNYKRIDGVTRVGTK